MKDLYRDNFESDRGPLMAAVVWTCGLLYSVAFYFVVITVLEWIF